MRQKGKISDWKDDRGFGFILPDDGSPKVFFHIHDVQCRDQRPAEKEWVTFELAVDGQGRGRAVQVAFVQPGTPVAHRRELKGLSGGDWAGIGFSVLVLILLGLLTVAGKVLAAVFGAYLIASAVAFFLYRNDKAAARAGRWRTPEVTLLAVGFFGGWPGALIAQRIYRHKSRKASFQIAFWVSVVVNLVGLGLVHDLVK
jgi:uncharacterized membrane protein YsdA (DUF1294 family)/cold shock CspA family protein